MAFYGNNNKYDIERGSGGQLYPGMLENPQMRWGFIRKVYSILCVQLLITFGIALAMTLLQPVRQFMRTQTGMYCMIAAIILTFILLFVMLCVSQRHPWNYVVLFLFTIAMAFMIGASCTQRKGEAVLLAAGLTLVVTIALTVFTFFAAKRGIDFSFLGPFLMCAVILLMAFGIIRVRFITFNRTQRISGPTLMTCTNTNVFCYDS
ncbi:hypothetical protein ACS0TY_022777 [Phlomoides rotata]